jgi:uncharacterized protein
VSAILTCSFVKGSMVSSSTVGSGPSVLDQSSKSKTKCMNPSGRNTENPIDRLSPTRRPHRWAVMRQKWRDLLFLHWAVSPQAIRPLVPPQLDLDLFEGTAYIGLVPFTMTGVRPVGFPAVWGLSSFHETNLRTYVRIGDRGPGVWFFNLEAANSIAVRVARALFHLPYHRARMFLEHERRGNHVATDPATIVYAGVRLWPGPLPASYTIRATPGEESRLAQPGTLEHFLIERYILYAAGNNRIFQGQVHHTPYPIQSAILHSLDETLLATWNLERPDSTPLVHFSKGVDVEVFSIGAAAANSSQIR